MSAIQGCLDMEQRAKRDLSLWLAQKQGRSTKELRQTALDYIEQGFIEERASWLLQGNYGHEFQWLFYFQYYQAGKSRLNWRAMVFQALLRLDADIDGEVLSMPGCNAVWNFLSTERQESINAAIDKAVEDNPVPSGFYELYKQRYGVTDEAYER